MKRCLIPAISLGFFLGLSGCAQDKVIETTEDIPSGYSLLFAKAYKEWWSEGTSLCKNDKPRYIKNGVELVFRRYLPGEPRESITVWNDLEFCPSEDKPPSVRAYKILPGKYRFVVADTFMYHVRFDDHFHQFVFEVGEGEAVYIGDIAMKIQENTFRFVAIDNREEAQSLFRQAFKNSSLRFKTRLARNAFFYVND